VTLMGWVDELDQFLDRERVPVPKRGGTWLYCPFNHRGGDQLTWCMFRTRRWKTYRRHWRRHHR
jgi:hypothetical protein